MACKPETQYANKVLRACGGGYCPDHGNLFGGADAGQGVEVWYRAVNGDALDAPDLNREAGGAAGIGAYFANSPEEAETWGKNVFRVEIRGKILRGLADDEFIQRAEEILGTNLYSEMAANDDCPPAIAIYFKFRDRYGDRRAAEIMLELGYVGVEHASPRLGFGSQPNLVVFAPQALSAASPCEQGA